MDVSVTIGRDCGLEDIVVRGLMSFPGYDCSEGGPVLAEEGLELSECFSWSGRGLCRGSTATSMVVKLLGTCRPDGDE